mgnify:CR=1 FL=1
MLELYGTIPFPPNVLNFYEQFLSFGCFTYFKFVPLSIVFILPTFSLLNLHLVLLLLKGCIWHVKDVSLKLDNHLRDIINER